MKINFSNKINGVALTIAIALIANQAIGGTGINTRPTSKYGTITSATAGSIPPTTVQRILLQKLSLLYGCVINAHASSANAQVTFIINDAGNVSQIKATSNPLSINSCITSVISGLAFPAPTLSGTKYVPPTVTMSYHYP